MTLDECKAECKRLNAEDDLPLGFEPDWDPDPFHEHDLNEFLYDYEFSFVPVDGTLDSFEDVEIVRKDKKHYKKRKYGYDCH